MVFMNAVCMKTSEAVFDAKASDFDAIVFDIGGVFALRHYTPIARGMARAGYMIPADYDLFHRAHYEAAYHLAIVEAKSGTNEYDPSFWLHFERRFLDVLGIAESEIEGAVVALRTEVYGKEKPIWNLLLAENISAFHRIASRFPTAIVSNNDGTAVEQMIDFGVCQIGDGELPSVAAIVDSGVVGVSKPDPAIFTPALQALGTSAARTLYVGDMVHADIRGAAAAGMPAVQLDPYDLHTSFPHWRVKDVTELDRLLA